MALRRNSTLPFVLVLTVFLLFRHSALSAQSLPLTTGPVLPFYRALSNTGLDPKSVYKIREAAIDREDVHLWFNDGTIAFTQTVDGKVTGAFFEGDGEVLIRPPDRMERASLGLFTGLGVLEEHFVSAYLRFDDDTAAELQQYLRPGENAESFIARNDATARKLASMDAMRLAIAFTCGPTTVAPGTPQPPPDRVLHARVATERLGTFDVYFDTHAPEQIIVGQTSSLRDDIYYDLWMSFSTRSARKENLSDTRFHGPTGPAWTRDVLRVGSYAIHAAIDGVAVRVDEAGKQRFALQVDVLGIRRSAFRDFEQVPDGNDLVTMNSHRCRVGILGLAGKHLSVEENAIGGLL